MHDNYTAIERLELLADRLRSAGVAATIEETDGTMALEWTRERNGVQLDTGHVSIIKTRTGNYRFNGGRVSRCGQPRRITSWADARLAVVITADLANNAALVDRLYPR